MMEPQQDITLDEFKAFVRQVLNYRPTPEINEPETDDKELINQSHTVAVNDQEQE